MDIVKQYLEYFRDKSFVLSEEFHPFKVDAIKTVIQECGFQPRRFLSRFNRIIIEALSKNLTEITSEFAKTIPEVEEEEPSVVEEI